MNREEMLQIAKPILFNTAMVRAIQEERKSVTRRLVKPQPIQILEGKLWKMGDAFWSDGVKSVPVMPGHSLCDRAPYKPGQYLYVRETWCWCPCWDCGMDTEGSCCDETADKFYNYNRGEYGCYGYRAAFADNEYPTADTWHPSIHMPKEAARIFLRVTNTWIERLKDITYEGCLAEGIDISHLLSDHRYNQQTLETECRNAFRDIWDPTIPKKDRSKYSWNANPWVRAVKFERIIPD